MADIWLAAADLIEIGGTIALIINRGFSKKCDSFSNSQRQIPKLEIALVLLISSK